MKKCTKLTALAVLGAFALAGITGCDSYKDDEEFGDVALAKEQESARDTAVSVSDEFLKADFFVVAKASSGGFKFPIMAAAEDSTEVSVQVIASKLTNVFQPFLNEEWKQGDNAQDTAANKWVKVSVSDSATHKAAGVQILDTAANGITVFGIRDFKITTKNGTKTITKIEELDSLGKTWGGNSVYIVGYDNKNKVVDETEQAISDLEDKISDLEGKLDKLLLPEAVLSLKSKYTDADFFINVKPANENDKTWNGSDDNATKALVTAYENGSETRTIKSITASIVGSSAEWTSLFYKDGTDWTWKDNGSDGAGNCSTSEWQTFTWSPTNTAGASFTAGMQIYIKTALASGEESRAFAVKDFKITFTDNSTITVDKTNYESCVSKGGVGTVTAYANE